MSIEQLPAWWGMASCIGVVGVTIAALLRGKTPADHVLLGALGALVLFGALSPREALSGFANEGMATVALLFIVSEGLTRHGGLKWFVTWMLRATFLRGQLARMFALIVSASSLLNNTAVVAMFVPELKRWSDERGVSLSKLLIPLSYAAILGGTCTLIGTSTNLLVAGMAQETAGVELGLLSLAPVGVPMALLGALFMVVVGPMLLPSRQEQEGRGVTRIEELTLAARVQPGGVLVGRRLDEITARSAVGLYPVEIEREGSVLPAPSKDTRLKEGDVLVFAGRARALVELCQIEGLLIDEQHTFARPEGLEPGETVEVVLTPRCPLVGQEIGNGRFRAQYDAAVLAILREGRVVDPDARQRWILSVGDRLMLEVGEDFKERAQGQDFILLHPRQTPPSPTWKRALSMTLVIWMVIASASGLCSIFHAALATALGMVLLGLLSFKQALESVDRKVILTIAAAIGLGQGIEATGVARVAADLLLRHGGGHPMLSLTLVYLVASLLTQLITNNAAAVLVLPFALTAAQALHVSPLPFVVAVMFAASASFATPFGYQTNLMVYGAGNYTFGDFLRVGLPMNLLCGLVVMLLIPLVFPF